ncbi:MAG: hypothetical protein RLZZ165_211 [Bacteroidota bacterium]
MEKRNWKSALAKVAGHSTGDDVFWNAMASHARWIALGIFLVNVALKLPYLDGSSLFLDEAVAIHGTQGTIGQTIEFSANDPTPPLYYLVLGLWCKVFGISELSARFPSMLFSSATAALVLLFGIRHFNARAGLFAAAMFTVSGIAMVFAHEARAYALASMLMVISYGLFLDIVHADRPPWGRLLGIAVVNAMLLYTHYLTAMGIATQAVLSLWMLHGRLARFFQYVLTQAAVLALWLPWVFLNRSIMPDSRVTSWLKAPDLGVLDYVTIHLAGSRLLQWYALGIILAGTLAMIHALTQRNRPAKGSFALVAVGSWCLLSLAIQYMVAKEIMPVFDLRYVLYVLPGGHLLLGAMIALLPLPRIVQHALAGAYIGASIAWLDLNPQKPENWRDAVAWVRDMDDEHSAVVVMAYYQYVPFSYYYRREYFQEHEHTATLFNADHVHFIQDTALIPRLDDSTLTNLILVLSQDELVDPTRRMYHAINRRYCLHRRGAFPGVMVYQFLTPPCERTLEGNYLENFEAVTKQEERDRVIPLPDSEHPGNHATFVDAGHPFSATMNWKASEIHLGNFSAAECVVRGKLADTGKRILLVYTMEHAGEVYHWTGFELQQAHGAGEWFEDRVQVTIPEVKGPDDKISVYFWSPEGGAAQFDDLEVSFWER